MSIEFEQTCKTAGIIPVIEIDDANLAPSLASALKSGGLNVVELTMRTPSALAAMQAMKVAQPQLTVGMGTILNADSARRAADHGADFLVSPGLTPALAEAATTIKPVLLPGVATPGDVMLARDYEFRFLKFFPAAAAGGVTYLKAFGGPFGDVKFCPTGGIGPDQAQQYLSLANVVCVGGSWVATRGMINDRNWAGITANAQKAAKIVAEQ